MVSVKRGLDKTSIIINLYRPPQGKANFIEQLSAIIKATENERYADIYLLGDLNLDHTPSQMTSNTKSIRYLLNTYGLTQKVQEPTRVTTSTKTLLDVIYVKSEKKIVTEVKKVSLSDHYLVLSTRYLRYLMERLSSFYGRTYQQYTFDKAKDYYCRIDQQKIYNMINVEIVWAELKKYMLNCANVLCPLR